MNKQFSGIITPLVTPLNPDYSVDRASLKALIDDQLAAGVNGLFILGSTGEVALLPDHTRLDVIATASEHIAGRVPLLAGAIDMTTLRVIEHARAAEQAGADAVVVTAPFYTRTHSLEIENHFRAVSAECGIPVVAYDLPISVGTKLSLESVIRLAEEGVIAGVKDSSGDDVGTRKVALAAREKSLDHFSVMTGSELTVDSAYGFGVSGCVPGLGNVDPYAYVRLQQACLEKRWEDARAEQERLISLFNIVGAAAEDRMGRASSALGSFKAALVLRGVISGGTTAPPYIALNDKEIGFIENILKKMDLCNVHRD